VKIIFNLARCGLGNNGGSQTLLRTAIKLREFGHNVKILLNKPNKFTWFEIPDGLLEMVSTKVKTWPKCNIIMATGWSTVDDVVKYALPYERKFYWMRAHETWGTDEETLFAKYKSGLKMLVNSEWQKEFLFSKCSVPSQIQYPGIPEEMFKRNGFSRESVRIQMGHKKSKKLDKIVIGALYCNKARKRMRDIFEICDLLNFEGLLKELMLFGTEDYLGNNYKLPVSFLRDPSIGQKLDMMSACDIWLATTDNEGLHIPPMEAGLCGCNLVVRGLNASGMSDYAINETTAKTFFTVSEAVEKIKEYLEDSDSRMIHQASLWHVLSHKIGSVDDNVRKLEKIFEKALSHV